VSGRFVLGDLMTRSEASPPTAQRMFWIRKLVISLSVWDRRSHGVLSFGLVSIPGSGVIVCC
jgi:hypothetical protein